MGTYTVTYNAKDWSGITAIAKTRTVTVVDFVSGIQITPPTKTTYTCNEDLDLTGATAKTVMASGVLGEAVPITTDMITGYDKTVIGKQTITVNYSGKTAEFEVSVEPEADDYVTGIEITSEPTKTIYKHGENISLAGAKFKKIMNSGVIAAAEDITASMISRL